MLRIVVENEKNRDIHNNLAVTFTQLIHEFTFLSFCCSLYITLYGVQG
jgi:hypothetical protein